MKKREQIKVGSFVHVKEKAYRGVIYFGVVTESFSDMIQIYGSGHKTIGFHEFDLDEIQVTPIEKEKIKFLFDQEILEAKSKAVKAEIKMREAQNELAEVTAMVEKYL